MVCRTLKTLRGCLGIRRPEHAGHRPRRDEVQAPDVMTDEQPRSQGPPRRSGDSKQNPPPPGDDAPGPPAPPYEERLTREDRLFGFCVRRGRLGSAAGYRRAMVVLLLFPRRPGPEPWVYEWIACAKVYPDDLARVMREGLRWSAEGAAGEGNSIGRGGGMEAPAPEGRRMAFRRVYNLADDADNEPRWYGDVEVFSDSLRVLSEFRMADLAVGNVAMAVARDRMDRLVYFYDATGRIGPNVNALYDDMPMTGWWPWPREPGAGPEEEADGPPFGENVRWAEWLWLWFSKP